MITYLSRERGDVQGGVSLLGGRVDLGAPGDQLLDHVDVALLGGQVEGVQTVRVARVDVRAGLEVLQDLLEVAAAGGTQEGSVVIGLELIKRENSG